MTRKKLGLALGGGSARGLSHIGVLKVLTKHKIFPDYIAGTSMGAVIGAMYAVGHSPEDISKIANSTDWKSIVDFAVPQAGLIQGKLAESKLRRLVSSKSFKDTTVPLSIVAFNLTRNEQIVFSKGDLATAIRASTSIPGIFNPVRIGKDYFVDGGVCNPTPFDIVKDMGADVVLAVDLFTKEKKLSGKEIHRSKFFDDLRKEFVLVELINIKNYLIPQRWPGFLRKLVTWAFEKILYPAKLMRIMTGKEMPRIHKVMFDSMSNLMNNLAVERLKCADVDIVIHPKFGKHLWSDFNKVDIFVNAGEEAMEREISKLKKKLK
jgi:predicted acylesterase/phospholipase RssA